MAWLLPRLFFRHFGDTSFAVEEDGELIAFHTAIGFSLKESDTEIDGVPVHRRYDGPDRDRVVFEKMLCSLGPKARECRLGWTLAEINPRLEN